MDRVIHKLVRGTVFNYALCATDGVKERNTAYLWRKVTCTLCLKRRKVSSDVTTEGEKK